MSDADRRKAGEAERSAVSDADGPDESPKTDQDDPTTMEGSKEPAGGSTPPAEAFGTIANQVRVGILRALFGAEEPRSFSDLREEVGVDDSGRFNYHLGELEGRFVRNGEAGYELTYAGRQVIGSIHSGIYTDQVTMDPVDAGQCLFCDGRLRATYEDEIVEVRCVDCEQTVSKFGVAPTLVEGFDQSELPLAFSRWIVTGFQRTMRGFCPNCSGRTRLSNTEKSPGQGAVLTVVYTCDVCGSPFQGPIGLIVLDHPEVVAFHDEHEIDPQETLVWEIPWLLDDTASKEGEDPLRVRVTPEIDGDRISLVLDEDMSVVSVDPDP